MQPSIVNQNKIMKWVKKVGFWGFLFFLAKGLVWLAIGYFVVK